MNELEVEVKADSLKLFCCEFSLERIVFEFGFLISAFKT